MPEATTRPPGPGDVAPAAGLLAELARLVPALAPTGSHLAGPAPGGRARAAALGSRQGPDIAPPGRSTLVGIDGWSGAGKTTLAAALAAAAGATVVEVEDLLAGWEALAPAVRLVTRLVLRPLSEGRPAIWPRWDWDAGRWEVLSRLAPGGLVLVEGCGAGAAACRPWLDGLIWVDAPTAERRRRLEARGDWATYRRWTSVWSDQERALRRGDDPSARADAVVRWDGPDPVVSPGAMLGRASGEGSSLPAHPGHRTPEDP